MNKEITRLLRKAPDVATYPLKWLVQFLQTQEWYRLWLRDALTHPSIRFLAERHLPEESAYLASHISTHVEEAYLVQGIWGERTVLCRGWLFLLPQGHEPEAWITNIWVHPMARGGQLGRKVVEQLLSVAQQQDRRNVGLTVEPNNEAAIRLYQKMDFGFVPFSPPGCFRKVSPTDAQMCVELPRPIPVSLNESTGKEQEPPPQHHHTGRVDGAEHLEHEKAI